MRIFLLLIFLVSCSSDETKSADLRLEDKHDLQSDFGPDLSDNKAPLAFDLSVNTFFERSIACTLEGRDPDGDSLEFEILSQPENGTLSGDLPDLTYKPKLGFLGKDGFTFRISDGSLFSDAAEVKISVTAPNEKPVLTILQPELDSVLGSAKPVELKASAIDAEDGDISASIKWESSLDGVLGEGENIEVMLSVGEHFIRAEVVDSGDKVVSTTVNLDIIATYPTQIIGTSGDDDAGGIAIDSNANLYVAGSSDGSIGGINLGGRDGFLIKHDSEGKRLWAKSIASSGEDTISGIVVDQGNNIFVIGSTTGSIDSHIIRGGQDAFIIKFDLDGNIIWSKQFGSSDDDLARGLHIDTTGEIYVVGETRGSLDSGIVIPNQESDGFIIKFDTLGNEIWTRQILNVGKQSYESVGIGKTLAGEEHIFVTGNSNLRALDSTIADDQLLVVEFQKDGTQVSVQSIGNREAELSRGLTEINGKLYNGFSSTGFTSVGQGGWDAHVRQVTTVGFSFKRKWGGRGEDIVNDITSNGKDRLYVVGRSDDNFRENGADTQLAIGGKDIFIASFSTEGATEWIQILGNSSDNEGKYIVEKDGFAYLLATTEDGFEDQAAIGGRDLLVIQFDKKGTRF